VERGAESSLCGGEMAQTQPTTDGVQKEYETKLLQYVQQLDHSEISDYSKVRPRKSFRPAERHSASCCGTGALLMVQRASLDALTPRSKARRAGAGDAPNQLPDTRRPPRAGLFGHQAGHDDREQHGTADERRPSG
jgi:hypothetical protein